MGWLLALGLLALLLMLPLGVSALYNTAGLSVYLIFGHLRLKLFPMKQKEKKTKPKLKAQPKPAAAPKGKHGSNTGGSIKDFLPLLQTAVSFLGDFRKKLRVNRLEMKLILAGGDPCDLAINYGRAWTAVGNLMPRLEQLFVIKKRDIEVECDFTSDNTLIFARLDLSITLARLLTLGIYYGIRVLCEYMKIMNQRKGGAKI